MQLILLLLSVFDHFFGQIRVVFDRKHLQVLEKVKRRLSRSEGDLKFHCLKRFDALSLGVNCENLDFLIVNADVGLFHPKHRQFAVHFVFHLDCPRLAHG